MSKPNSKAKKKKAKRTNIDKIGKALMNELPKRDQEVMEWVAAGTGKTPGLVCYHMTRAALVRERVGFREAHGGGGASSQNPELLAGKLPRR